MLTEIIMSKYLQAELNNKSLLLNATIMSALFMGDVDAESIPLENANNL